MAEPEDPQLIEKYQRASAPESPGAAKIIAMGVGGGGCNAVAVFRRGTGRNAYGTDETGSTDENAAAERSDVFGGRYCDGENPARQDGTNGAETDRDDAYVQGIINKLRASKMLVVEGTVYPLLTRLKNTGLLAYRWEESTQGPPRKYYNITEQGRQFLQALETSWEELTTAIEILKAPHTPQ